MCAVHWPGVPGLPSLNMRHRSTCRIVDRYSVAVLRERNEVMRAAVATIMLATMTGGAPIFIP